MSEAWHPPPPGVLAMLSNLKKGVRMNFDEEPWAVFVAWDA